MIWRAKQQFGSANDLAIGFECGERTMMQVVNKMAVNEEQGIARVPFENDVAIEYFLKKGFWCAHQ
jgi:hypothetical protein